MRRMRIQIVEGLKAATDSKGAADPLEFAILLEPDADVTDLIHGYTELVSSAQNVTHEEIDSWTEFLSFWIKKF